MTKFVLVGTQRSGTTLLRTHLDSHPDILCLGEAFYINKIKPAANPTKPKMGKNLSKSFSSWREHSYQHYINDSLKKKLTHIVFKGKSTEDYLDCLYSTPGFDAIGFKLMMNQLHIFPNLRKYIERNDIHVIHIIRNNAFSILVSSLSMKQRGYAHATSSNSEIVKIRVPVKGIEKKLRSIQQAGKQWSEIFSDYPSYLMVNYEEYVKNKDLVNNRLLNYLDVDSSIKLHSELVKLNTAKISEIVENIDEVRSSLSGTEFSWCLDEIE